MSDFIVVGLGSMGKRRVRDLLKLEAGRVIGVDQRDDQRAQVTEKFGVRCVSELDQAMSSDVRAVMVCVPPHMHHKYCRAALEAGAAYFVECLIALTLEDMDDLIRREKAKPGYAFPSCTKLVNRMYRHVSAGLEKISPLYSIHTGISTWLPLQHPWEKAPGIHYEFHRAQGGGLAEPAFHLSYIYHTIRQRPVSVIAHAQHASNLPEGVNDILDMIIELDGGARINFHYALCEKHDYTVGNFLRFSGEGGTAFVSKKQSRVYDSDEKKWTDVQLPEGWTNEESYLTEMQHFLDGFNRRQPYIANLEVERDVLATLLAAEKSSAAAAKVSVDLSPR